MTMQVGEAAAENPEMVDDGELAELAHRADIDAASLDGADDGFDAAAEGATLAFEALMAEGKAAFEANDFITARERFRAAAEAGAERLEPHRELCRLAYRQRDWMDLYSRSTAFLARRPNDREILLLNARASSGLGDWTSAAESWNKVAEDRAGWPEARYQVARARIRLGYVDAATEIAERLDAEMADNPEAGAFAVRLFVELDALSQLRGAFERLYRAAPQLAAKEFDLLDRQNEPRGLAIVLRVRYEVEGPRPGHDERQLNTSETLFREAIIRERAGDLLEAFLNYEALLALSPEDGLAARSRDRIARELRFRAEDALVRQNLPEAAAAFPGALRAAPQDAALKRAYGRVLMRERDWTRAVAVWRGLADLVPQDAEAALQLARALDRSGRFSEAIVAWKDAQAHNPGNAEIEQSLSTIIRRMIFAGRAAIAEERFLDAYDLFKAVVREAPDEEEGRRRLDQVGRNLLKAMRAAYKAGDLRSVVRHAEAAADLLPDDPEVRLLTGRAASGMRRYGLAIEAWSRLAELDPESQRLCNLQIARCHLHLGAIQEGQQALRAVMAEDPENAEARELMERFRTE
jgi:tetratricopeptide (TPR) repeat protein